MKAINFLAAATLLATSALHAQVTISSTVLQSDFNGGTGAGQSAPIAVSAFDFTSQTQLMSISSISITLTMIDGDTGLGPNQMVDTPYPPPGTDTQFVDDDFDVNSLSLALDGIDLGQGLLLNGFDSFVDPLGPEDFVTRTITGTAVDVDDLLNELQDGFLVATVFDSTGVAQSNGFRIPDMGFGGSPQIFATLSITGEAVPEPSAAVLAGLGIVATTGIRSYRRRFAKRM